RRLLLRLFVGLRLVVGGADQEENGEEKRRNHRVHGVAPGRSGSGSCSVETLGFGLRSEIASPGRHRGRPLQTQRFVGAALCGGPPTGKAGRMISTEQVAVRGAEKQESGGLDRKSRRL